MCVRSNFKIGFGVNVCVCVRAAVSGGEGGGGERSLTRAPQLFPLRGDLSYGC